MSGHPNPSRPGMLVRGGRPSRASIARIASALVFVLLGAPIFGPAADVDPALEYKVKGGYLFNIARFVEWPGNAFASTNSPLVFGVLDAGEAAPVLRALFEGKTVNGRRAEVRSIGASQIDRGIHLLLVTRAARKSPEELQKIIGDAPMLLVGETDEFAERGGAIAFVREGESVRLTLCHEHASQNGVKVSSKLASVAKPVKSRRKD